MVQTVTRPVVSMFAACAYCPASTSFSCLRCGTAICPDCVPGDLCPDCTRPAPVAPLMVLGGWSMVNDSARDGDCAIARECAGCGETIYAEDDDALCAACELGPEAVAALRMVPAPVAVDCLFCGQPMYGRDTDAAGTRHPRCARFLTALDSRRAAWKEERLAA